MKYYLEITLADHPKQGVYDLWGKLFTQLHLALVPTKNSLGNVSIGISFPEYRYEEGDGGYIGNKLRVFSETEEALNQLDLPKQLSRLINYLDLMQTKEVPFKDITGYASFKREHIKGSLKNLSKRYAKRHNMSIVESEKYFNGFKNISDLPYLSIKSLSKNHPFRLFISKVKCESYINEGFGTYGLSSVSTVPEF